VDCGGPGTANCLAWPTLAPGGAVSLVYDLSRTVCSCLRRSSVFSCVSHSSFKALKLWPNRPAEQEASYEEWDINARHRKVIGSGPW